MRLPLIVAGVCAVFCVAFVGPGVEKAVAQYMFGMDQGVDRPGSDYTSFDLDSASPESCQAACGQDGRCRAFSYVAPGYQGPHARCWLKNAVPARVASACCYSGVKYAPGASYDLEDNTDRPGEDYVRIVMTATDPSVCRSSCQADNRCYAFTYVKPGVQGPAPICYLKSRVDGNQPPRPTSNTCCVSGVVAPH